MNTLNRTRVLDNLNIYMRVRSLRAFKRELTRANDATTFNVTLGSLATETYKQKEGSMARKKQSGAGYANELFTWRPNPAQKKLLKTWLTEDHDWPGMILNLLSAENKLSAVYYGDGDAYFVTVTCRQDGSVNSNRALSVRHSDALRALGAHLWLSVQDGEIDWKELTVPEDDDW